MKNSDLDFALAGMNDAANNRMKGRLSSKVHQERRHLERSLEHVVDAQKALIEQHEMVQEGNGFKGKDAASTAAFVAEFTSLMSDEVEYTPIHVFDAGTFDDCLITPDSLKAMINCGILKDG